VSNLDTAPPVLRRGGHEEVSARPVRELLRPRITPLGESTVVRRLLPNLGRRMVGAWCFVDHYGPDDIADEPGMWVPPHPHTGLQTVSWLHAEQSPRAHAPLLHGAQLWVALPDAHRHVSPAFEHHTDLPLVTSRTGLRATVILGEIDGAASPGTTYSPLVGADLSLAAGTDVKLPLEPDFEYAVLTMSGSAHVDGVPLDPGSMLYLGCGRRELALRAAADSGLLLLGGEPFDEKIVMWWNFIGRSGEEIAEARADWNAGRRFGTVHGFEGNPTPAPDLPEARLKARGRER